MHLNCSIICGSVSNSNSFGNREQPVTGAVCRVLQCQAEHGLSLHTAASLGVYCIASSVKSFFYIEGL